MYIPVVSNSAVVAQSDIENQKKGIPFEIVVVLCFLAFWGHPGLHRYHLLRELLERAWLN